MLPILGSLLAIPLTKIIEENKIIESKKLAVGPAETVKALDIIDALLKWLLFFKELLILVDNELGSKSPSNFTNPPKGSIQIFQTTPDLSLNPSNFGPNPILNSWTPIPHLFPT